VVVGFCDDAVFALREDVSGGIIQGIEGGSSNWTCKIGEVGR
jgi:hypothetical protein